MVVSALLFAVFLFQHAAAQGPDRLTFSVRVSLIAFPIETMSADLEGLSAPLLPLMEDLGDHLAAMARELGYLELVDDPRQADVEVEIEVGVDRGGSEAELFTARIGLRYLMSVERNALELSVRKEREMFVAEVENRLFSHLTLIALNRGVNAPLYQLTFVDAWDEQPTFSPDGQRLMIISERFDANRNLLTFDIAQLSQTSHTFPGTEFFPVYSPDGGEVAFQASKDGSWDIWVRDVSTGETTRLTGYGADEIQPTWSPDGQRIAFASNRSGVWDIWAMDSDGGNPRWLTHSPARDLSPSWSNRNQIAYVSDRSGNFDIWILDLGGGDQVNITDTFEISEFDPSWSPDGRWLAISANRASPSNFDIWVIDPIGNYLERVTEDPAEDYHPAWSPDGRMIVFQSFRHRNADIFIKRLGDGM